MKKTRIFAACLLVLSLLLTPFTPVSAAEDTAGETTEVTRVEEVVALRETNSETYLMSDGTYECVIFSEDKYYRDSNDALQLIDNSIVAVSEGAGLMAVTQYQNAANTFDITLSGSGTPEVSIAYQGAGVTFSPIGATRQGTMQMTASDTVIAIGAVDNCAALDQLTATGSNTATYSNAFPATDLIYVLENEALKEYIILKDTSAPNEFSFLFELDGLTMQTVDGFTHFVNGNEEAVFTLGSLFAVDANGKPTDALTYDFVPVKGNANQVIVTVTLDNDYLTATDRAFPVVIDPTVTVSSSETADTCVCSYFPSTNYYLGTNLRTGYDSDYGIRRSYLKFNIPTSIPSGRVTNATLDMERVAGAIPTTQAYRVTSNWTSSTLTWNTFGTTSHYDTSMPSSQSVVFREGSAWYTMNVTSIVRTWLNNPSSNYGFVVKDVNESTPDHWTTWYSSDAVSPHKPELIITYEGNSSGGGTGSGGAVLIGVTDPSPSHDHSSSLTTIKPILESCGYNPVNKYVGSFTEATIDAYLSNATNKIFVSRSHGDALIESSVDGTEELLFTSIILNGSNHLIYYNINSIPADISNMELVVFVGCVTGYGGEGAENLPTYAVRRGATTAIGFEKPILCVESNQWTESFFELLEEGTSVDDACTLLKDESFSITGHLDSVVVCGDGSLTIN